MFSMPETLTHKRLPRVNGQAEKIRGIVSSFRRVLFYRPADDLLSLKKNLSVALEKGKISCAFGEQSYARPKIKDVREYSFNVDKYPLPKEFMSTLVSAITELDAAGADITLSIPKAWAVIKTVDFPVTIKENMSGAVSNELDRITPYTSEEAFFDFRILSQTDDRITLVIMAAKADAIRPYLDAARESGLEITRVTVNLSTMGTIGYFFDNSSDTIFIAVDKRGYEGALFVNGIISRTIAETFTADSLRSKAEAVSQDINSLIDASRERGNSPRANVIIKDDDQSLRELLRTQSDMKITFVEGSADYDLTDHTNIPYSAACGSVLQSLWAGDAGFNLLSKGRQEQEKLPVILTVILLIALVIALAFFFTLPVKADKERLETVSQEVRAKEKTYREIEILQKEITSLESEVAFIRNFKKGSTSLDILNELTSLLPETAWLSNITVTETTVSIVGFADSATELLPKLETSGFFGNVEFASPTFQSGDLGKERFNIKMVLEEQKNGRGEKTDSAQK
jgi:Tfp pilus assembly protein PilN